MRDVLVTKHRNYLNHILTVLQFGVFKAIGLSPWTMSTKNYFLKNSYHGSAYNLALILLIIALNLAFIERNFPHKRISSGLTTAVEVSLKLSGTAAIIFIWILYTIRQRTMVSAINRLANIKNQLKRRESSSFIAKNNQVYLILMNLLLGFCLLAINFVSCDKIIASLRYVPSTIIGWVLVQFSLLLHTISGLFKSVKKFVLKLGKVPDEPLDLFTRRFPLDSLSSEDILGIKFAHLQLCKVCEEIDSFYGLPVLIIIIYFGSSSTFGFYFMILSLLDNYKSENFIDYGSFGLWFFLKAAGLLVMTSNVTRLIAQRLISQLFWTNRKSTALASSNMEHQFSLTGSNSLYFFSTRDRFFIAIQYLFFKIIGLSPWALDLAQILKKKKKSTPLITRSIFGSFYNILLIILIATYNMVLFASQDPFKEKRSLTSKAVQMSLRISGVLTAIFVWLSYIFRQNKMAEAIRKLINADGILAKCCYKTNALSSDSRINFAVLSHFFSCCLGFVFAIKAYSIVIIPVRMVPGLINSWVMIQFSLVLNMITNRLKSVNYRILRLGNGDTEVKPQAILADKIPLSDPKMAAADITNIRGAHAQLCEVCGEVLDFFGIPVLIAIIYSGVSSIFYLYFVILSFFEKYSQESIINYLSVTFWFSYMVISFIFMTFNVTRIILQSKQTADAIHLVLDRCTMDLKIHHQLTEFSRDLLHQKLEFSACGIISLDNSLLFAVSGTIVTYLIILIQFRLNNQQT